MTLLDNQQLQRAKELMNEYLDAPVNENGTTPADESHEDDRSRVEVIENELSPLLRSYLRNEVPLLDFKLKIDSISKRHQHWGFKGIKGQMFFNMIVNTADNQEECDQEIKSAISTNRSLKLTLRGPHAQD